MNIKHLKLTFAAFFFLYSVACGAVGPALQNWFSLLASPEKFDGKAVRLNGWLEIDFTPKGERYTLYMSSEDMREGLPDRAITLDSEPVEKLLRQYSEVREDWLAFNGTLVSVDGTFAALTEANKYAGYPTQGTMKCITAITVQTKKSTLIKEKSDDDKNRLKLDSGTP